MELQVLLPLTMRPPTGYHTFSRSIFHTMGGRSRVTVAVGFAFALYMCVSVFVYVCMCVHVLCGACLHAFIHACVCMF